MRKPTARLFLFVIVLVIGTIAPVSSSFSERMSEMVLAREHVNKSEPLTSGSFRKPSTATNLSRSTRSEPKIEQVRATDLRRDGVGWLLTDKHLQSDLTLPESVVLADIAAQNVGDWDTYLKLRTEMPGAPENISNYKVLWQQEKAGIRGNVVSARLDSFKSIPFDFARELVGSSYYFDTLTSPQAFYVILDYEVRTEDKYVCNGPNARLYILDHGDDGWKIVQVSEPPITALVNNGFGVGSDAEQEMVNRQQARFQTGQFLNSHGQVVFSTGPAVIEAHQFPSSITVAHFSPYPGSQYQYLIGCVDFITYIKNVLPNEWIPSWPSEALKAGAVTAKMAGWYSVLNCKYCNQGYDVSDQENDQAYRASSAVSSTDDAVNAVAGVGFDRADGTLFYPGYRARDYDDGGYHGGKMYQYGTWYLADHGYSYNNAYMDMVHYYYDYSSATTNESARFFRYTEGGAGCPSNSPSVTQLIAAVPYSPYQFTGGQRIRVINSVCVRSTAAGATCNGTQPTGATGVVLSGPVRAQLSGKTYDWYQIDYDSSTLDGWSAALEIPFDDSSSRLIFLGLHRAEVAAVAHQAQFHGFGLVAAMAIAEAESIGMNPSAVGDFGYGWCGGSNPHANCAFGCGSASVPVSFGLWQINTAPCANYTYSSQNLLSSLPYSAQTAWLISNSQTNFGPWSTWSNGNGSYKNYVSSARAALAANPSIDSTVITGTNIGSAGVRTPGGVSVRDTPGGNLTGGTNPRNAGDTGTIIDGSTGTTYLAQVGSSGRYYFWWKIRWSDGQVGWSAEDFLEATGQSGTPGLSISSLTPTALQTLDWGQSVNYSITVVDNNGAPVSGATAIVTDNLRALSAQTSPTNSNGQTTYTTTVPTGAANSTYDIVFRANKSGYSDSPSVTRQVQVSHNSSPPAPTANSAANVTSSSFTSNWGSSSGATGYRLDVSTSISFGSFVSGYQNLDLGNLLSRSVSGLSANTTYYYRVRAYNGGGTSGDSNIINVTTAGNPPPTRTLTVMSSNPSSGVSITVSPNDNNGLGSGVTPFNRVYNNNTNMALTAPSTVGGNNFKKWQLDGADLTTGLLTNFVMDANHAITAVYGTPPQYQGFHDGAGCNTISGWAWDANNPNGTVNVDIYDGTTFIGTTPANMYREDLLNALGSPTHGFSFLTPAALKNGAVHIINVKFSGTNTLLSNTTRTIRCSLAPNLWGRHDGQGCNAIEGWAWDANDPSGTVNVDIYDGATLISTVACTLYRQDLADVIGNPYHGFIFHTPDILRDGHPHTITVKFGGTNTNLPLDTPRTTSCITSTPNYQGNLDVADCNFISGYAWDSKDDQGTINAAIYVDGGFYVVVPAQEAYAGIGSGYHGFKFAVPASLKDGQQHSILVKFSGTSANLSNTPRSITCISGQQLLGNPGFESGEVAWNATPLVITNNAGQPAHGGAWKAWLDGYGATHADTLSQTVAIPSGAVGATLTFWLHIDTDEAPGTPFDTLKVQVRNAAGTVVLATLATYSNLDGAAGYSLKSFDLTSFRGQTVTIYFEGMEDISLQTTFVIDDTALSVQ